MCLIMFNTCLFTFGLLLIPISNSKDVPVTNNLHMGLTEKIGNFSIEILYHTAHLQKGGNLILSPITVWSVLALIAEGASDATLRQISIAIRIPPKRQALAREAFQSLSQYLHVNTSTIELQKFNALFIDVNKKPMLDFVVKAKEYQARMITANFSDPEYTTNLINVVTSNITHGRIPTVLESNDLTNTHLILTSVLFFNGKWTIPFNASYTSRQPFYDDDGKVIGEVNMMYNKYAYSFANIKTLQARVIELPYGEQNRLSMLIMLPYPGVSVEEMFSNFHNLTIDSVFNALKLSKEKFSEDEVECYIPRFKIETSLDLTNSLKALGIYDLFDETKARLPFMSFVPTYVSKMIHKAEIEVTEQGTTASAVTLVEFSNRIGAIRFEANRPFCYLIIEKITNSITFGGIYQSPSLY